MLIFLATSISVVRNDIKYSLSEDAMLMHLSEDQPLDASVLKKLVAVELFLNDFL